MAYKRVNLYPKINMNKDEMADNLALINLIFKYTHKKYPEVIDLIDYYKKLNIINMENDDIYREICWIIYNSGFKYEIIKKYWSFIQNSLDDFNVNKVALMIDNMDYYAKYVCNKSGFNNIKKAKWCIYNANRILELDKEKDNYDVFKNYLIYLSQKNRKELIEMIPNLINDFKLKGIGKITIYHLLKNIGIDIFKPDIHLCRTLKNLQIINNEKISIKEIYFAMEKLSDETNMNFKELDTLFFIYGMVTKDTFPSKICF